MTKDEILELYPDEEFLFADGFDECIIGIDAVNNKLIYSVQDCVKKLQEGGMEHGEAVEYLYFNAVGAYVGDKTPIWCE